MRKLLLFILFFSCMSYVAFASEYIQYYNNSSTFASSGTFASTSCDGAAYCAHDLNFNTAAYSGGVSETYIFANYTFPTLAYNVTNATYLYKAYAGTYSNVSLVKSCLNQTDRKLKMRYNSHGSNEGQIISCRNTNDVWVTIKNVGASTGTGWIFEIPMYVRYTSTNATINLSFWDESDNILLSLPDITVSVVTDSGSSSHTVTTGILFLQNLTASNITIGASANYGYSYRQLYIIPTGANTTQQAKMFLSNITDTTTFTIYNRNDGLPIEDALVTMYGFVGGISQVIESKLSDVSGRVPLSYTQNVGYSFTIAKSGFVQATFNLNPIAFDSYSILLTPSSLANYSTGRELIITQYAPGTFQNEAKTRFNISIRSPFSALLQYGFNLSYPGGTNGTFGNSPAGSTLSASASITGAQPTDQVLLTYFYTTQFGEQQTYSLYLPIANVTQGTFLSLRDGTYGMGILERILAATIIAIIFVGLATFLGHPIPGLAIGMFAFAALAYVGFIPTISVIIPIFIAVIFLVTAEGGTIV